MKLISWQVMYKMSIMLLLHPDGTAAAFLEHPQIVVLSIIRDKSDIV